MAERHEKDDAGIKRKRLPAALLGREWKTGGKR